MQILPFKPYPFFDWVVLGICLLFAFLRSEAAIISGIWFGFFSYYLCNKFSLRFINRRFTLPSKSYGFKKQDYHFSDFLLFVPFFAGILMPMLLVGEIADCFTNESRWGVYIGLCK